MTTTELAQGLITPEGVATMRELVQVELRRPFILNTQITYDAVRKYCWGIGDDNPLYLDEDYARTSEYGAPVAPQGLLYTTHPTYVQVGLPGVHGLHAGTDWTFFAPVPTGFTPRVSCWLNRIEERESSLAGNSVWVFFTTVYADQDGKVIAQSESYSIRSERKKSRERGKESGKVMKVWTPEELEPIEQKIVDYTRRGGVERFWDDVCVGDAAGELLKGPLCATDMIAWYGGSQPVYQPAHGMALKHYRRHPKWAHRNAQLGVLEPNIRVHESMDAARSSGLAAPYDVGIQRHQWLFQMLSDWGGDGAFTKQCSVQFRGMNYFGDLTTIAGTVTEKFVDADGDAVVRLEVHSTNQDGKDIMPGSALVALPRRDGHRPVAAAAARTQDFETRLAELAPDLKRLPQ
ncbi:MaoC family dehydratase N-terminal domain-containing protein [Pseudonocardia ailaonensis]|uniref:MaoC family dehydratase N-terminal domain-containing protein n=1 Tax=Pseudonocardia ailaonensis TaxID=367279 RepID=A0ABN2MWH0_9PSEU